MSSKEEDVFTSAPEEGADTPDNAPLDADAAADVAAWANEPGADPGAVTAAEIAEQLAAEQLAEREELEPRELEPLDAGDVAAWAEDARSSPTEPAPEPRTGERQRPRRFAAQFAAPVEHAIEGGDDAPPEQDDETASEQIPTVHNVTYVLCDCGCRTEAPIDETETAHHAGQHHRLLPGHKLPDVVAEETPGEATT